MRTNLMKKRADASEITKEKKKRIERGHGLGVLMTKAENSPKQKVLRKAFMKKVEQEKVSVWERLKALLELLKSLVRTALSSMNPASIKKAMGACMRAMKQFIGLFGKLGKMLVKAKKVSA